MVLRAKVNRRELVADEAPVAAAETVALPSAAVAPLTKPNRRPLSQPLAKATPVTPRAAPPGAKVYEIAPDGRNLKNRRGR